MNQPILQLDKLRYVTTQKHLLKVTGLPSGRAGLGSRRMTWGPQGGTLPYGDSSCTDPGEEVAERWESQ